MIPSEVQAVILVRNHHFQKRKQQQQPPVPSPLPTMPQLNMIDIKKHQESSLPGPAGVTKIPPKLLAGRDFTISLLIFFGNWFGNQRDSNPGCSFGLLVGIRDLGYLTTAPSQPGCGVGGWEEEGVVVSREIKLYVKVAKLHLFTTKQI
ncbi:hypothetical protein T310_8451 [Rasamsonia emersonii CBS 393.64]|uniref:Uncharacterized protein n=1 Tax=Rasamsonia emersonii (strain ATCC 16479 / CBS 393.64 / IMI 116815) TaxID=1408163 RepID=A0A0F4YHK8_RASE3|nr:hypothetical protein T310_8451 [Rasamsonia emersonii CBS 393.64]KKA17605.1 hypothetical protein T310_8451 [Rasamsonia emersonii CBS 393.64]